MNKDEAKIMNRQNNQIFDVSEAEGDKVELTQQNTLFPEKGSTSSQKRKWQTKVRDI